MNLSHYIDAALSALLDHGDKKTIATVRPKLQAAMEQAEAAEKCLEELPKVKAENIRLADELRRLRQPPKTMPSSTAFHTSESRFKANLHAHLQIQNGRTRAQNSATRDH